MKLIILVLSLFIWSSAMAADVKSNSKTAIFAGGCFWCLVPPFDKVDGVIDTEAGYIGGLADTATYEHVSTGATDHREAIAIVYDDSKVSYSKLLSIFFDNTDPFDPRGQFSDKGKQYTTAIYYNDDLEKTAAANIIKSIEDKSGKKVATVIEPMAAFYPAEEYHQDYYKKNPIRYKIYKEGSGR